ncbi:hypothetical protein [Flavobacterium sp.]|jgi:hypothetical protein|uniref:hypothetical protein n=1 Tax=Flavobacterium sp. TaxID=239 RepID=UPI0037BE2B52
MGIKIGDIDIANQIIDNDFRIGVLEKILEKLLNSNKNLVLPTQMEIEDFREKTATELKAKYPNSGIEYTKKN